MTKTYNSVVIVIIRAARCCARGVPPGFTFSRRDEGNTNAVTPTTPLLFVRYGRTGAAGDSRGADVQRGRARRRIKNGNYYLQTRTRQRDVTRNGISEYGRAV